MVGYANVKRKLPTLTELIDVKLGLAVCLIMTLARTER